MSFITGFENDIFISYCHFDNAAPTNEQGWVDLFHEELESWLVRRFGHKKISIWRDEKLHGCTLFDNRIQEQIGKSALFLALISPNYLKSEYCIKELEWFHHEAEKSRWGLSVNNEYRIFNVLLNNIHHTKWPVQLKGTSGFPMHDQGEGSENLGEFLDHHEVLYDKKLRKIVDAVETTIKLFPDSGDEIEKKKGEAEEKPAVEVMRIFIADTSDTLQNTREKLVEDLMEQGTHILTRIPPPYKSNEHEDAIKKAVDGADLAIHLLDGWPGREIEDLKSLTYPRSQVETGLRSHTRQLVWVPKDLEYQNIEDREYANFLESLEHGERGGKKFEFIRDEKNNLPHLVRHTLGQIQREIEVGPGGNHAPILLDTHQKDQRFAFKLGEYLNEKGVPVEFNQESRDPASGLRNFEEALRYAHSLVIIYGSVAPAWVLERLKKTLNLVCAQLVERYKTSLVNRWICLLPSCNITSEIENLAKDFRINYLDNRHSETPDEKIFRPLIENQDIGGAV